VTDSTSVESGAPALTLDALAGAGLGPFAESMGLVGRSGPMLALGERIKVLARSAATVLVLGETGTGKELIASALHSLSPRSLHAFVPHNFSAIPDSLVESEVFGHVKGAFTGAQTDRPGLFELADKGTLFLDEIGDASPTVQSRLLRVLQEGEVRRVGDTRLRRVDVRVVAATHRDLESEVRAGRFRADLFYRLHVLALDVPPLRERREDVPLLAAHALRRLAHRDRAHVRGIRSDALGALIRHAWPGNVRELMGVLERAVHALSSQGWVTCDSLGERFRLGTPDLVRDRVSDLRGRTRALEAELIRTALLAHGGNKARAARDLGLTRQGLWKKIRRMSRETGIDPDSP